MKVTVQDLIQNLSDHSVTLVAGEHGVHRRVSMVHIVENLEIASFLLGGEIVVINGIAITEEMPLLQLMEYMNTKAVAAIVICTGPYIPSLEPKILQMANHENLPLFVAPWEIYCGNLIKDISKELIEAESKNTKIEVALKALILGETKREFYEEQLLEKGWNVFGNYCVALISCSEPNAPAFIALQEQIKHILDMHSNRIDSRFEVLKIKGRLVLVFCDTSEEIIYDILYAIQTILPPKINGQIILSKRINDANFLCHSYALALKMLPLFSAMQEYENPLGLDFVDYEQLDLYKILLDVEDSSILKTYYDQTIAPLVQYDTYRGTDLCNTLKAYMKYNGSVTQVSETLYAHRNTISKQINKIETILNRDLSNWQTRSKIMLGLFVQDFISHQ